MKENLDYVKMDNPRVHNEIYCSNWHNSPSISIYVRLIWKSWVTFNNKNNIELSSL